MSTRTANRRKSSIPCPSDVYENVAEAGAFPLDAAACAPAVRRAAELGTASSRRMQNRSDARAHRHGLLDLHQRIGPVLEIRPAWRARAEVRGSVARRRDGLPVRSDRGTIERGISRNRLRHVHVPLRPHPHAAVRPVARWRVAVMRAIAADVVARHGVGCAKAIAWHHWAARWHGRAGRYLREQEHDDDGADNEDGFGFHAEYVPPPPFWYITVEPPCWP